MSANDKKLAMEILQNVRAVLIDDHFVYTSGRHGSAYVNKDAIYPHTQKTSCLCCMIARHFLNKRIDVVVGPALGGIPLSQWTAHHLTQLSGQEVLAAFTEENDGRKVLRRGYSDLIPGRKVLLVEDVTTTGNSARKSAQAIRKLGGQVAGMGLLCNRKPREITAKSLRVPELYTLTEIPLQSWPAEDCPLCKQGIPVNTTIGKGAQWLKKQQSS